MGRPIIRLTQVVVILMLVLGMSVAVTSFLLTRPHQNAIVPYGSALVADYRDFEFISYDKEIFSFLTGYLDSTTYERKPVARVYVRGLGIGPIPLPTLPEDFAVGLRLNHHWELRSSHGGGRTAYVARPSMLEFIDGRITYADLGDNSPLEFGPSKDGPFVSLPMSRERMVEVFGKPKRWYWSKR